MDKREIKKYLFPTLRIKYIRNKYFKQLKELIGVENFLGYKDASDDDRVDIQENYEIEIARYIRSKNKNRLFIRAYKCVYLKEIANVLLHSIVIDELFDKINSLDDIYYDKNNVLYFDNEYPRLFNSKGTIVDYCRTEAKIITHLKLYFLEEKYKKMKININLYNRESLEKMSIFELRNQARFVGVERPVSKSREQIIAEMLQIINGKTT